LYVRTMSAGSDAERLQASFAGIVRALGLFRPDTTPCGLPMSITEAHAISELHAQGPGTQQQLADALRLQKSTVSRLIDELARSGLVERAPNPDDRRSHLIHLTTEGSARAGRLEDARRDLFERLLAGLTTTERRTIVVGIARLEEATDALDR